MVPPPGTLCGSTSCRKPGTSTEYCVDCATHLCEECWPLFPPHVEGKVGRDGVPHEPVDYGIYVKFENILNPKSSDAELKKQLMADLNTTWFGIRKKPGRTPMLVDHDIYARLTSSGVDSRYYRSPQLVSFVGNTNAGKSTLIRMLIQSEDESSDDSTHGQFPTPIVGAPVQSHMPTSADVHLYADPGKFNSKTPLLYADCEGFEGGEKLPVGAVENFDDSFAELPPGHKRRLNWADTPEKRARGYAVSQLYPRILYTFSDVIVFVLKDSKTFESATLRPLLEWAETSLETSINQPALPHVVVVLNSTDTFMSTEREWEPMTATQNLLRANKDIINVHPYFAELARSWRQRGSVINDVLDLIKCYYSAFQVVRIPIKGRYKLLSRQIACLRHVIINACDGSFKEKRRARMLSCAEELNVYLQSAFEHFSKRFHAPFNFIEASLRHNPIPDDFGGHILQMAISIQSCRIRESSHWVFDKLSPLVASSIMLDCVRYQRKGTPKDLLIKYTRYIKWALAEFCDLYSPCEFETATDICVNVATNHQKGHQNSKGKVIGTGHYRSQFVPQRYLPKWRKKIEVELIKLDYALDKRMEENSSSIDPAYDAFRSIYSPNMERLLSDIGTPEVFSSHSTCFCCLMHTPQHSLPCGHVLCNACVRFYGKQVSHDSTSKDILEISRCPLHPTTSRQIKPRIIRFKPDYAGVRLLCLDGGGMRGIVELEVLSAIERKLGSKIPIRAFFDLVVGTSTGGIVALGFGVKGWTLRTCSQKFESFCRGAFSPRKMHQIPGIRHLIMLKHAAKYETKPLRRILKNNFGDEHGERYSLFGCGSNESTRPTAKVAVTATDSSGKRAIVIANYNRKDKVRKKNHRSPYEFLRPNDPFLELEVWEAAAATSAAPSFFKPFVHLPTSRIFLDGALYHNNPVRIAHQEGKVLWPDMAQKHPDIFLSIGTGQGTDQVQTPENESETWTTRGRRDESGKRNSSHFRQIFTAMHGRLDSILDAETSWREFIADTANMESSTTEEGSRYIRINPSLHRPLPALDQVSELEYLKRAVRRVLKEPESQRQIERVAHKLIASLFYYERNGPPRSSSDVAWICTGQIRCRFENGSEYLRHLSDILRKRQTDDYKIQFEIRNDSDHTRIAGISLSQNVIAQMREKAYFSLETTELRAPTRVTEITISLRLRGTSYPISGFPRAIMAEEDSIQGGLDAAANSKSKGRTKPTRHRSSTDNIALHANVSQPRATKRTASAPEPSPLLSELDSGNVKSPVELPSHTRSFPISKIPHEAVGVSRIRPSTTRTAEAPNSLNVMVESIFGNADYDHKPTLSHRSTGRIQVPDVAVESTQSPRYPGFSAASVIDTENRQSYTPSQGSQALGEKSSCSSLRQKGMHDEGLITTPSFNKTMPRNHRARNNGKETSIQEEVSNRPRQFDNSSRHTAFNQIESRRQTFHGPLPTRINHEKNRFTVYRDGNSQHTAYRDRSSPSVSSLSGTEASRPRTFERPTPLSYAATQRLASPELGFQRLQPSLSHNLRHQHSKMSLPSAYNSDCRSSLSTGTMDDAAAFEERQRKRDREEQMRLDPSVISYMGSESTVSDFYPSDRSEMSR